MREPAALPHTTLSQIFHNNNNNNSFKKHLKKCWLMLEPAALPSTTASTQHSAKVTTEVEKIKQKS